MCTCWIYLYSEASVIGHEIFKIYFDTQLLKYINNNNNNNNNNNKITGILTF